MLLFLVPFYLVLLLPTVILGAEEGRSFIDDLNLCLKYRIVYILWFHFGWIFNIYPVKSRKSIPSIFDEACEMYLRHGTLDVSNFQPLRIFYWVFLRLRKFLLLKWKRGFKIRYFPCLRFWCIWKKVWYLSTWLKLQLLASCGEILWWLKLCISQINGINSFNLSILYKVCHTFLWPEPLQGWHKRYI